MPTRCPGCDLNKVPISEAAIATGWRELSARPGLAKCLLDAIERSIEPTIEGTPLVQNSLNRQRDNELGLRRSRALASCYLRHQTGECTISSMYKYANADFTA
jgi:hypothetical protein